MSIESFIRRVCVQTAIYWGNPQNDGYGGFTYDSPVEIPCRWVDKVRVMTDNTGVQITSRAEVLLTQQVDMNGYMYLGSLDDFEFDMDITDPRTVDGAYSIYNTTTTPLFRSTTKFVYQIVLVNY